MIYQRGSNMSYNLFPKLLGLLILIYSSVPTLLYSADEKFLLIESGMHVAPIWRIGVDKDCQWIATASLDKTVRLWKRVDTEGDAFKQGHILRARIGPDNKNNGRFRSVAISPDSKLVAAGAWAWDPDIPGAGYIYVFDRVSGELLKSWSVDDVPNDLAFSQNGTKLAASLWGGFGHRVWETKTWYEIGRQEYPSESKAHSYGLAFDSHDRLYTIAYDGYLRRYKADFTKIDGKPVPLKGKKPYAVAVHPNDSMIAIAYHDQSSIDVYLAEDLDRGPIYQANGLNSSDQLLALTWSPDGKRLYGGGKPENEFRLGRESYPFYYWEHPSFGNSQQFDGPSNLVIDLKANKLNGPRNSVIDLVSCGEKHIVLGAHDPAFFVLDIDGNRLAKKERTHADMRGKLGEEFTVSDDGSRVRYNLNFGGIGDYVLFDLNAEKVSSAPEKPSDLYPANIDDLEIKGWNESYVPTLKRTNLALDSYELARSLAIGPDKQMFVLGSEWAINLYDGNGRRNERVAGPAVMWGVNIPRNGRVVVAATGDGTIRWYRLTDLRELLALYIHPKDYRWVAWTPNGFYMASVGGEDLIGWHVNRERNQAADFFSIHHFGDEFNRPDIVKMVLKYLDEDKAKVDARFNRAKRINDEKEIIDIQPPVVEILSPGDGHMITEGNVKIKYKVRSPSNLQVTSLDVAIDGERFGDPVQLNPAELDKELFLDIPLERDSTISLVAYANERTSEKESIFIKIDPSRAPLPEVQTPNNQFTIFALVFGISEYNNFSKLYFAAKDAVDVGKALKALEANALIDKVYVKVLTDTQVSRDSILQGFRELRDGIQSHKLDAQISDKRGGSKTVAIIFYSGHGILSSGGDFYMLPPNARPQYIEDDGVGQGQLAEFLGQIEGNKILFLDACRLKTTPNKSQINSVSEFMSLTRHGKLEAFSFASTEKGYYSIECPEIPEKENPNKGNGCFTAALLNGLKGMADSSEPHNIINTDELATYLNAQVRILSGGKHIPAKGVPDLAGLEIFPYIGNYYLVDEPKTCRVDNGVGPTLKTWTGRLEFKDGKVSEWQNLCDENPVVHKYDSNVFQFFKNNSDVLYKNKKYTYFAEPPM